MPRARASSGRAAKRLGAATPGASLPLNASLLSIVASLEGLDIGGLRHQWRAHLGGEAASHLSRWLLMKVLAYRLQSDAFGDLDKSIRRILRPAKEDGVAVPFDRRAPQTREGLGLKAGALLVREWNGRLERILILEEGFAWKGQTFGSLSKIAKAMTGTNWNGHASSGCARERPFRQRRARIAERAERAERGPPPIERPSTVSAAEPRSALIASTSRRAVGNDPPIRRRQRSKAAGAEEAGYRSAF
jgi:hypothetical protein